jgi:hypothetical protein
MRNRRNDLRESDGRRVQGSEGQLGCRGMEWVGGNLGVEESRSVMVNGVLDGKVRDALPKVNGGATGASLPRDVARAFCHIHEWW